MLSKTCCPIAEAIGKVVKNIVHHNEHVFIQFEDGTLISLTADTCDDYSIIEVDTQLTNSYWLGQLGCFTIEELEEEEKKDDIEGEQAYDRFLLNEYERITLLMKARKLIDR